MLTTISDEDGLSMFLVDILNLPAVIHKIC